MVARNIVEDDPSVKIPDVDFEGKYFLNGQTAYNRSVVEGSERCGCFHCGSTFSGRQVSEWLEEEDGEDTALCPYCGEDAVIVGGGGLLLSTALLTALYQLWYEKEFEDLVERATYTPKFSGRDDYMRKGIPFLMSCEDDAETVGEITLFPTEIFDKRWGDLHDNEVFATAMDAIGEAARGGMVSARAYFDERGYYVAEFIDEAGVRLPYEPWTGGQQDLLLELSERYGDSLKGMIPKAGSMEKMKLVVKR